MHEYTCIFFLKKERNGIDRKLIDRPNINKCERRPWVLASRLGFFLNPRGGFGEEVKYEIPPPPPRNHLSFLFAIVKYK